MNQFIGLVLFIIAVASGTQGLMDLLNRHYELAAMFLIVAAFSFIASDKLTKECRKCIKD